jgi:hypothetical protein
MNIIIPYLLKENKVRFPGDEESSWDERIPYEELYEELSKSKGSGDKEALNLLEDERRKHSSK